MIASIDPGQVLPHEPPILMLDEVVDVEPGLRGTGLRRFRAEDACFRGHFPGRPILPGVLALEALAQAALVVLLAGEAEASVSDRRLGLLAKVQDASFYEPIRPGDEVRFEVEIERKVGSFWFVRGEAVRGENRCARARLVVSVA